MGKYGCDEAQLNHFAGGTAPYREARAWWFAQYKQNKDLDTVSRKDLQDHLVEKNPHIVGMGADRELSQADDDGAAKKIAIAMLEGHQDPPINSALLSTVIAIFALVVSLSVAITNSDPNVLISVYAITFVAILAIFLIVCISQARYSRFLKIDDEFRGRLRSLAQ
ncbi:MAG: hypothetical protein ABF806_00505 [Bifidobacterium psychraerophilum]|jgi:hypothetical protein|uniref:hypothetical protein n=1 Tax=Bifidobacterium psychraerophilum TaxID=218140 RepID=UPI0039EBDC63